MPNGSDGAWNIATGGDGEAGHGDFRNSFAPWREWIVGTDVTKVRRDGDFGHFGTQCRVFSFGRRALRRGVWGIRKSGSGYCSRDEFELWNTGARGGIEMGTMNFGTRSLLKRWGRSDQRAASDGGFGHFGKQCRVFLTWRSGRAKRFGLQKIREEVLLTGAV